MTGDSPRILFLAPSAYPLGGVQTWLDYLLPGLVERGWRATLGLVAGRFHDVSRYLSVHPWSDTVAIRNPTGSREGRVRALLATIERLRPAVVVSVNIPDSFAAVERLRLRRQHAPRVVMTNHSVEAQYLGDAKSWRAVLDAIIGTNRLTCHLAMEWAGLEPSRVFYAPYGVEVPSSMCQVDAHPGPLRIAYSGRLDDEQKRVGDIPGILERLEAAGVAYELRLAGAGPAEAALAERLRSQVEAGRARFLGVLAPDALSRQLYDWADLLLVTSYWETGPIVIWEAMARGLPVVTSRYIGSGLENSLRDGDNCLMFPIGDVAAAAEQLQRMNDPGRRAELAARGRALVAERYTRPHSVKQWDACLRTILSQPRQRSLSSGRLNPPAGRLDRWLGIKAGESARRRLRIEFAHSSAGGEWPHVAGGGVVDQAAFLRRAADLDRRGEGH